MVRASVVNGSFFEVMGLRPVRGRLLTRAAETQIVANMMTSPHHLGATMKTDRRHRMTDLFGRLAPGATVESARAELTSVHAAMLREHPDMYSSEARIQLQVRTCRNRSRRRRPAIFGERAHA